MAERDPSLGAWVFLINGWTIGIAIFVLVVGVAMLAWLWWRIGRDREFIGVPLLSATTRTRRRPMGAGRDIVIEYAPPEGIRPAQMGMLLYERARHREFTATMADLAARGYVRIDEIEGGGQYGGSAWRIRRLSEPDDLELWERALFDHLFGERDEMVLGALTPDHWWVLRRMERQLQQDVAVRRWFPREPASEISRWRWIGWAVAAGGVAATFLFGSALRIGIAGLPIIALGLALVAVAPTMVRRTPAGSEMVRRCLGFREFVARAGKDRHEFDEDSVTFTEYLPYAIVFGVVDKWADAFKNVNTLDALRMWTPDGN